MILVLVGVIIAGIVGIGLTIWGARTENPSLYHGGMLIFLLMVSCTWVIYFFLSGFLSEDAITEENVYTEYLSPLDDGSYMQTSGGFLTYAEATPSGDSVKKIDTDKVTVTVVNDNDIPYVTIYGRELKDYAGLICNPSAVIDSGEWTEDGTGIESMTFHIPKKASD